MTLEEADQQAEAVIRHWQGLCEGGNAHLLASWELKSLRDTIGAAIYDLSQGVELETNG